MAHLTKITLDESKLPTHWYNIIPDLPTPLPPPLHPATRQPLDPKDLLHLFPSQLIEHELSNDRYIQIPDPVRQVYKQWRPTPLFRARRLERFLNTPAHIYYKYEGVSPTGSHKPNSAVPQAYYNHLNGVTRLTTETGAGQWGSALAFACSQFQLECDIFQVRASVQAKPYRATMMRLWGANVYPSPSDQTDSGRRFLSDPRNRSGSLGIAISEAVEVASADKNTRYALGSVLNHVLLHQTVIGQEAKLQMQIADSSPDVIVACTGGGSNFAGLAFPFLPDRFTNRSNTRFICAEPAACPSLTAGQYGYDFGDTDGLTPLLKMYSLGHSFVPHPIHAGGLRYHGMAPLVSHLVHDNWLQPIAINQTECFKAATLFAKTEGILMAPEPSHAIAVVLREAAAAKLCGEARVILTSVCGHGHLDLSSYQHFLDGQLDDAVYEHGDVHAANAVDAIPKF